MHSKKSMLLTATFSFMILFSGLASHAARNHDHFAPDLPNQYRQMVYQDPVVFKKWAENIAQKRNGGQEIMKLHNNVKNWALIGPKAFKNFEFLNQLNHQKHLATKLVNDYGKMVYRNPALFNKWLNHVTRQKDGIQNLANLHNDVKNWALKGHVAFKNYYKLAQLAKKAPAPKIAEKPITPDLAPVVAQPQIKAHETFKQNPQYAKMLKHFEGTTDFDSVAKKIKPIPFGFVEMNALEHVNKMKGPKQGWKLHVSAKKENMYAIAKLIFPYLEAQKVGWKFASSQEFYEELCQTETQGGKFITIYSPTNDEAVRLAQEIDKLLLDNGFASQDFVKSKYEALVGKSGGVFARYGAYTGNIVYKVDQNNKKISDDVVFDDREKYKPDFITHNPFGSMLVPPQQG